MAHEMALMLVNDLKQQLAFLARAAAQAVTDGKVSPLEGLMLSLRGTTFATALLTVLQGADPVLRQEVLYVLEQGQITLPQGLPLPGPAGLGSGTAMMLGSVPE